MATLKSLVMRRFGIVNASPGSAAVLLIRNNVRRSKSAPAPAERALARIRRAASDGGARRPPSTERRRPSLRKTSVRHGGDISLILPVDFARVSSSRPPQRWKTCGPPVKTPGGYAQESHVTPGFPRCADAGRPGILSAHAKASLRVLAGTCGAPRFLSKARSGERARKPLASMAALRKGEGQTCGGYARRTPGPNRHKVPFRRGGPFAERSISLAGGGFAPRGGGFSDRFRLIGVRRLQAAKDPSGRRRPMGTPVPGGSVCGGGVSRRRRTPEGPAA